MPGNNPIQDETGQAILAAVQQLTAAVNALTKELSDMGDTQTLALADSQHKAYCLQAGKPYTPPAATQSYAGG